MVKYVILTIYFIDYWKTMALTDSYECACTVIMFEFTQSINILIGMTNELRMLKEITSSDIFILLDFISLSRLVNVSVTPSSN